MSFEILEYPIKTWILELIDDEKIKSDIFDLLGEPDVMLKYPSMILYDIDNLVDHKKHDLVVRIDKIQRSDDYLLDLKNFSSCRKVCDQLIGILNDSNIVLQMIVKTIDKKWIEMFEFDKLYITLMNGMKLKLSYDGSDKIIEKKISSLYMLGFKSEIEYAGGNNDDNENNESDNEVNDEEMIKQILSEIVAERKLQ